MDISKADQLASSTFYYSVLSIGLLPKRMWSTPDSDGVDISGLGSESGQLTPYGIPYWEGTGTDVMHIERKRMEMPGGYNRPILNDAEVNVLDYTEAIATGFTKIYNLLVKYRTELLSDDGPLKRFAEDEVRVILRPTRLYSLLLNKSFHPDFLRNALERDRLFDRLWVGIQSNPYLAKVIPAEREDLEKGDIPMFTTSPSSRDLRNSSYGRIANFFDESSMSLVQLRLQLLNEADLKKQLWFIRASLTTLSQSFHRTLQRTYSLTVSQNNANREQLLASTRSIGDRLEAIALRGENDVSWIGLTITARENLSLVPSGLDLYDGLPGIALFLAYLGAITQEERYINLAQATLTTLQHQIGQSQFSIKSIGAFDGWGGLIYALTHLGVLWDKPELLAEAEVYVEKLPELIEEDQVLDIIGGAAGCIGSLLSLYCCAPSNRILAVAIQCGDHLLARAQTMKSGIAWNAAFPTKGPLTGFAHGAAGIAWALLELASLTGEKRFQTIALRAIEYERSLFCSELSNWPDLRNFADTVLTNKDNQPTCMTLWCHGAPGIGLARLHSLKHIDDSKMLGEIDAALKNTFAEGFGLNHSLCHGDLGNLEFLLQASQILDKPQLHSQVNRIAAKVLESIKEHGWLCGVPLGVETPGLMTGLAGIGYGLLRLAEPTLIPSVLVLEPPQLNSKPHFKKQQCFLKGI